MKVNQFVMTMTILLCLITLIFILNLDIKAEELNSNVFIVGFSDNSDFSNIQDAIINATDGDIIFIEKGIYYGNFDINKKVNLIGEDKNTTIIYGDKFRNVINVNKNNISISNLSIGMNGFLSNNSNLSFSGIYFKSNSNIIENCIISNNIYGIIFENSSNNIIRNCIFSRNNNGLHFINSSYNQLSGCNIIENEIGVGILLETLLIQIYHQMMV